ncbi:MAG: type transport system permease protein [Actinomycetota bacterium]|jgi:ABC-2 type transport system permease protein|nr:type transport system permease protein [Actinomycetota bacterium]
MTVLTPPVATVTAGDAATADDDGRPPRDRWLRSVLRLTGAELRLVLREPMVAVALIGFPLATVLILAGVFGQAPDPDFGGVAPSQHYLAGYVGVVLAAMGLITVPVHMATHRELGVLRRFRSSGLSAGVLVASEILLGAVLGTAAAAVVLAAGAAIYGLRMPVDPVGVVGWYMAGLTCFIAIGVALGSLLPSGRSANALGNLLFVPMLLLGGGGPPRAVMTGAMRRLSDALPLSHLVGGLRQAWLGRTTDPHTLWWPLVVAAVAVGVAVVTARRRAG